MFAVLFIQKKELPVPRVAGFNWIDLSYPRSQQRSFRKAAYMLAADV